MIRIALLGPESFENDVEAAIKADFGLSIEGIRVREVRCLDVSGYHHLRSSQTHGSPSSSSRTTAADIVGIQEGHVGPFNVSQVSLLN